MTFYSTIAQLIILESCINALELLETKMLLDELQPSEPIIQLVYDEKMQVYLQEI